MTIQLQLVSVNVIGIIYVMGKGVRTPRWETKNVDAFIKLVHWRKNLRIAPHDIALQK